MAIERPGTRTAGLRSAAAAPALGQQLTRSGATAEGEDAGRGRSGMARPTSRAELAALLQRAADSQTVAVLDPATDVTVDRTVEVVQRISTSRMWGVIGNGA